MKVPPKKTKEIEEDVIVVTEPKQMPLVARVGKESPGHDVTSARTLYRVGDTLKLGNTSINITQVVASAGMMHYAVVYNDGRRHHVGWVICELLDDIVMLDKSRIRSVSSSSPRKMVQPSYDERGKRAVVSLVVED